jgi:hypothetical protein
MAVAADYLRFPSALAGGLGEVLNHPGIWRRNGNAGVAPRTQSTGNRELDAALPGGGWPIGALTEILVEQDGIGEMSLVMPALAALSQQRKRIAMIAPPYIPYAPALVAAGLNLDQFVQIDSQTQDTHWSAEQCLRAGCCSAVLHWLPSADYRQLRRLQLAAESGDALAFFFRPIGVAQQSSPAALRLLVSADNSGTSIEILKCRGNFETGRERQLRFQA